MRSTAQQSRVTNKNIRLFSRLLSRYCVYGCNVLLGLSTANFNEETTLGLKFNRHIWLFVFTKLIHVVMYNFPSSCSDVHS